MNVDLTLSVPTPRMAAGAAFLATGPNPFTTAPRSLHEIPETNLVRVSAEGMSVMAVVQLLRETADQLDDDRYLVMNGEIERKRFKEDPL